MRRPSQLFVLVCSLICATALPADEPERRWGISPYLGLHQPRLDGLNEGEFHSPYEGVADFIDPIANNFQSEFSLDVPLPEFDPGALLGLELQWKINDRHALLIGIGAWETTSTVSGTLEIPIQGALEAGSATRKADLSYVEYYLGWRFNLWTKPGKHRLYTTINLHQLFDVEYQEDFTVVFLSGDVRTFRKTNILLNQATGLMLLEGMIGYEWFVSDWISLGLEGGYGIGLLEKLELTNTTVKSDFLATDNIVIQQPIIRGQDGRADYRPSPGAEYQDLELDFSGWKALIKTTLYF
jgi:hypothetical protein